MAHPIWRLIAKRLNLENSFPVRLVASDAAQQQHDLGIVIYQFKINYTPRLVGAVPVGNQEEFWSSLDGIMRYFGDSLGAAGGAGGGPGGAGWGGGGGGPVPMQQADKELCLDLITYYSEFPAFQACLKDAVEERTQPGRIHELDQYGYSILHYAVFLRQPQLVRRCMACGADPELKDATHGISARLMAAILHRHTSIPRLLNPAPALATATVFSRITKAPAVTVDVAMSVETPIARSAPLKPEVTVAAALLLLLWPLAVGGLLLLAASSQTRASADLWLAWGVTPGLTAALNIAPAMLFLGWMCGSPDTHDAPTVPTSARGLWTYLVVCLLSLSLGAGGVMRALHTSSDDVPDWVLLVLPFAVGAMLWPPLLLPLWKHRTCLGTSRTRQLSEYAKWTGVLFLTAAAGAGSSCLLPFLTSRSALEQLGLSLVYQALYYLVKLAGLALVPPRIELPLVFWSKLLFRTFTVAHVTWTGNYLLLAAVRSFSSPGSYMRYARTSNPCNDITVDYET
jgi:hypothetical protein